MRSDDGKFPSRVNPSDEMKVTVQKLYFGQTKNTRKVKVPRIFYIESAKIEGTARRDLKPSVKKTVRWTVFSEERRWNFPKPGEPIRREES